MCGIIGVFGKDNAVKLVSDGLSLMSYRGEDGNGIAEIKSENGILVFLLAIVKFIIGKNWL